MGYSKEKFIADREAEDTIEAIDLDKAYRSGYETLKAKSLVLKSDLEEAQIHINDLETLIQNLNDLYSNAGSFSQLGRAVEKTLSKASELGIEFE